MGRTGVLITGFGGPDCIDSVGPFMANLMGREPSQELIDRVTLRYLAIGGQSPLVTIARAIREELADQLAARGHAMPVEIGMCYWDPTIPDAIKSLADQGCDRIVTVSLSPYESKVAHGTYRSRIADALAATGLEHIAIVEAPLISESPDYVDWFAGATATALQDLEPNEGAVIVFTAHSLPLSDLSENDPYVTGIERVAQGVAEKLGLGVGHPGAGSPVLKNVKAFGSAQAPRGWFLAYQSKGVRGGEWLGPDVDSVIDDLAKSGATAVVVCPIGFMTDHLETMYDLDIDAAGRAYDADLEFVRVPVPNQDDVIVGAIASGVINSL